MLAASKIYSVGVVNTAASIEGNEVPQSRAKQDEPIWIPRLLDLWLKRKPDDVALVSPEGSLSWQELDRASKHYSAGMLAYGLKPGDRIPSLMPNLRCTDDSLPGLFQIGDRGNSLELPIHASRG
jgi:acyl-CoA synthetase (AMP-forming)/AMP-acid ligase II